MSEKQATHLLDARQAAERLGVSERTVRQMGRDGRLPVIRVGNQMRFEVDDLEEWLSERKRRAEQRAAPRDPMELITMAMGLLAEAKKALAEDDGQSADTIQLSEADATPSE